MLAMPTMPYYVTVSGAKLPTVSDWSNTKTRHGETWPCTGPAGLAGAAWAEHLLLLRNASATGLQQDICLCVSVSVCVWSQTVRRLDDSLPPRRLLPAGLWRAGGEGQALLLR